MLKLTWTVPCSSRRSYLSGIHGTVPISHVSTLSVRNKGLKANQLGLLLSLRNRSNAKMDTIVCNSVDPGASMGGAPWNSWQGLIFGVVVTLILPCLRNGKWGPFLAIKNRLDGVVDTIETVAEVVEDVASKVEDIAEDIAKNLPENGALKEAVLTIEKIAEETAKDAHLVDEFIEKMEDVEDTVESFFESSPKDQPAKEETESVEDEASKEETNIVEEAPKEETKNVQVQASKEETKNVDQPNK